MIAIENYLDSFVPYCYEFFAIDKLHKGDQVGGKVWNAESILQGDDGAFDGYDSIASSGSYELARIFPVAGCYV